MHTFPGTCSECHKRREVYRIGRQGGGTYRRGGRHYWTSVCGPCAVTLAPYVGTHAGATVRGLSGRTLRQIAAAIEQEEPHP